MPSSLKILIYLDSILSQDDKNESIGSKEREIKESHVLELTCTPLEDFIKKTTPEQFETMVANKADNNDKQAKLIKYVKEKLNLKENEVNSVSQLFENGQKKYFSAIPEEKKKGLKILKKLAKEGHTTALNILKNNSEPLE